MKRCIMLLLTLLLAAPAVRAEEPAMFEAAELSALTPAYGMDRAQIVAALGEPSAVETVSDEGNIAETLTYPQAKLTMLNDQLVRAEWEREDWLAPRGLYVGASYDEVLAMFPVDKAQKEGFVLYESGRVAALGTYLPPCGVVGQNDDGTLTILYQAPLSAYPAAVTDDPACYVALPHATLELRVGDLTRRVMSICWTVAPLAP